jgi:hypothetical protein
VDIVKQDLAQLRKRKTHHSLAGEWLPLNDVVARITGCDVGKAVNGTVLRIIFGDEGDPNDFCTRDLVDRLLFG